MNAPDALSPDVARRDRATDPLSRSVDAAFAGLLARERRQMARSFAPRISASSMPIATRPNRPWQVVDVALLFALGFFCMSLFLRIAFA
jgi:hypothetical protein